MKERFKDMGHLFRLAGLFLAGLLVFGIARAALVPAGFGTLGHYRAGATLLMMLPFGILAVLVRILPPWADAVPPAVPPGPVVGVEAAAV